MFFTVKKKEEANANFTALAAVLHQFSGSLISSLSVFPGKFCSFSFLVSAVFVSVPPLCHRPDESHLFLVNLCLCNCVRYFCCCQVGLWVVLWSLMYR